MIKVNIIEINVIHFLRLKMNPHINELAQDYIK